MQIIRSDDGFVSEMLPLFLEWGVLRCNVQDCKNTPSTIVAKLGPDIPICGFCEDHFQEANKPGGANFTLDFTKFDAFKILETAKETLDNDQY